MMFLAMKFGRTHNRLLSLFVVAFLCLNAGGLLCLAYCSQSFQAKADHCPLKKKDSAHCRLSEKAKATADNASFETTFAKCVMLPIGVFFAPIEKKSNISLEPATIAESADEVIYAPAVLVRSRQIPKFYYRPPPNDSRFERVRNQVFRI